MMDTVVGHRRVATLAAGIVLTLAGAGAHTLRAQDSTGAPPARLRPEFGLGLTTGVPAFSDGGVGPIASIVARRPAQKGAMGYVIGLSYAFVPLTRRLPDGSPNNSALEALYLALGMEWSVGRITRMDVQWNPAIADARRWGRQPDWRRGAPRQRDLSAASLGLRFGSAQSRIGYAFRMHASLQPMAFIGSFYPTFQVMLRP